MSKEDKGRKVLAPHIATALERVGETPALTIAELHVGDVVDLESKNHRYRVEILDPETKRVRVTSNGPHVTEPTEMFIAGSLLIPFGSMIMVGRIVLGHCIEFATRRNGPMIITPVRSIDVNGVRFFPRTPIDDSSKIN